jgi:prophage tail gpP-like protein
VATPLVLGKNVLKASGRFSWRDRYSTYTVKGQTNGTDDWFGEQAAQPVGTATDTAITRHRPLTLLAEEQADTATAQTRAEWERNVRSGRSRSVTYTVQGWTHSGGLWQLNRIVTVQDDYLGISQDLLLSGVTFRLGEGGTLADLTVCPPETFSRTPMPEPENEEGLL